MLNKLYSTKLIFNPQGKYVSCSTSNKFLFNYQLSFLIQEENCLLVLSDKYFPIIEQLSGNALDATNEGDIILYPYHGNNNQQWSWENSEKTVLINKEYYSTRLDFSQGMTVNNISKY